MKMRPVDSSGDVLPILNTNEMLSDAPAVALLVESRLNLFAGDWWENPDWGSEILKMLQEGRLTEADAQALSTYLADYVRETKGVKDVMDIMFSVNGTGFRWECTVITEYGSVIVTYQI